MLQQLTTWVRRKSALSDLDRELHPPLRLPVLFRTCTPEDFTPLLQLYSLLAPAHFPAHSQEAFAAYLQSHRDGIIVGELKGQPICCASVEQIGTGIYAFHYGLVHPDHQRQRIGTTLALLRLAATAADKTKQPQPLYATVCTVSSVLPFHQKLGFKASGTWTGADGNPNPRATLAYHTTMAQYLQGVLKWRKHEIQGNFRPYLHEKPLARTVKDKQGTVQIQFNAAH
jgi:GNAT superfamily N-acetyltransferase